MLFETLKRRALAALYPQHCPLCGGVITAQEDFCEACARRLPEVTYRSSTIGGFPCSAPLLYRGEYAEAVKRYKFGRRRSYAHALALLIMRAAVREYDLSELDCIACVPMHKRSLRRRGFNQAELLARECAAIAGLPFADLLEKPVRNKPQHFLKRSQRAANVHGVFRVREGARVANLRVLLIDDIVTTGNTLGECARILEKGGCQSVCCAVVCAAPC